MADPTIQCPFCSFSDHDSYILLLHVETKHSEEGADPSPFAIREEQPEPEERPITKVHTRPTPPGKEEKSKDDTGAEDSGDEYVDCPEEDCGESVLLAELQSHVDLHLAEKMTWDEVEGMPVGEARDGSRGKKKDEGDFITGLPDALHNLDEAGSSKRGSSGRRKRRKEKHEKQERHQSPSWRDLLNLNGSRRRSEKREKTSGSQASASSEVLASGVRRLGKAELGPHANEKRMPAWLRQQLEDGGKVTVFNQINPDGTLKRIISIANETTNMIPVIAQLCEQDSSLGQAYLCHPGVTHVVKMRREGGFCGYRNIQMLVSYIQAAESQGFEHFPGRLPTILHLQDLIEEAWDKGINSAGRIETGGIRDTRKYIGTPEAQALFISLGIHCEASAYTATRTCTAHDQLLDSVEAYFTFTSDIDLTHKVVNTLKPPLYFQHRGHSLTIIGLERRKNGSRNLLVFDPMFKPSPSILKLVGARFIHRRPEEMLGAYRRGQLYLKKFVEFELLRLTPPLASPEVTPPGSAE